MPVGNRRLFAIFSQPILVRWLSGRKQRFAKSKTAFRPASSHLILSLQLHTREAITPNRLSSRVLSRHLISYRRPTFLTYFFSGIREPVRSPRTLMGRLKHIQSLNNKQMKTTRKQNLPAVALVQQARSPCIIRCYWAEQAVLDGTWMPPKVEKVK